MPRKPRFVIPGVPMHIVQRGHCRNPVFFEGEDYEVYLKWLGEAAKRYQCDIHAYVLMTNHVHLLVTPGEREGIIGMMQYVGRRYVPYINKKYGKSGTLWEGRYRASLVQEEAYLFACMRYIELNPVRAGMVKSPSRYPWSSYGFNAQGRKSGLIKAHDLYKALDKDDAGRQAAYKALFKERLSKQDMHEISAAWLTGTPLGGDRFKAKVEETLKQRVGHAKRGRPVPQPKTPKGL